MRALVIVVLVVVGILAAVVGVIYFVEPIHSLPSFIPGHAVHGTGHHTKRGIAALAVAVVAFVVAVVVGVTGRRRPQGA